jgi:hypothetical protein
LVGSIPLTLSAVNLGSFYFDNTSLCEPADPAFQVWLATIADLHSTEVPCPAPPI